MSRPLRVLIAGDTSWYLWNFRRNVIEGLARQGLDVVVAAPNDEYSNRLADLPGVRWIDWPLAQNGVRPSQELGSLVKYGRIARQARPDFILNHGIKANIYGGLACRALSIPYANNVTGLGTMLTSPGVVPRALGKLYAFASDRAATLFIQNLDDLTELRNAGLSEKVTTVRTFGSGVDLERFAFAPMPKSEGRTFLFVGRLQRDKGIWDFVEAARIIRSEFPDSRFLVVGSQRFSNSSAVPADVLENWTRERIVEFHGQRDDVRPWLRKSHVLVLPSRREGMPRAILESAAVGRPSITYNVPGCDDAVIHDRTGYLCPDQDIAALTNAMRDICLVTDDRLAKMGEAARAYAEAKFSDTQITVATLAAIKRAFPQGAPP